MTTGAPGTGDPEVTAIQITSPSGFSLGSVELSVGSEVAVNEGTVTQQISEARVAIPSQAELDDIDPQGGDLRVDLFVDNVQVLDTTFRVDQGRTPQEVAERLRDHIEGQLTGAPTVGASIPEDLRGALQDGLSVEVVGAAGTDLSLIHI